MAGEIKVNILTALNDKGVKDAMQALRGLGTSFKNMAKQLIGAYVGFQGLQKGISFIRDATDAARDLERNMGGLKTIFGDASGQLIRFAEAGVNMGMSTAEAAKAVTFIGSVMKQSGFAMKDNIFFTEKLVALGADLAATYGYDVQEALTGMTALFRGEYDPIEKFGVAIKQAQVNAEMATLGLNKLTGQHKLHAQQLIRMKLLFAATSDVQGAFARQGDTLFVSQQRLAATFTDMQAKLGSSLIPTITNLVQLMTALTQEIGPHLESLFVVIGSLFVSGSSGAAGMATQIGGLIDQITGLISAFKPLIDLLIWIASNAGGAILTMVITFKILYGVLKKVIVGVTALRTVLGALAIQQLAATASATALAAGEVAVGEAAVASSAAMAATPWGAIALGVSAIIAALVGLGFILKSNTVATDKTTAAAEKYSAAITTGNGVMLDTEGNLISVSDGMSKVAQNTKKASISIAEFNSMQNARSALRKDDIKASKNQPMSEAERQTAKSLADFKKLMKEMGLLGGGLSGAADKAAKAMASPFALMVKDIQSNLAQVHNSIIATFDITNMGTNGGSISRNIDKFMIKLREFAGYIKTLRGMNLNGNLLQQLSMAGPEAGLAAAKAFAGDPGLVAQANAAYGELGMTSNAIAGSVVAAKAAPVYNISVNAGLGDKKTIGLAVVEAIKAYERSNNKKVFKG